MKKVDYSKLLCSFWEKRIVCALTSCEADFYYYLLKQCDLGNWANPFKLPTKKCELELDFSRKTISSVRNSLHQKGFINFKASKVRGEVAEYEIVGLAAFLVETQTETQSGTQTERKKEDIPPIPPIEEKKKEVSYQTDSGRSTAGTLHQRCRKFFEAYVSERYPEEYYWTAKDAGQLKVLLNAIRFTRKSHKAEDGHADPRPTDDENMFSAFKAFVEYAYNKGDTWLLGNFTIPNLSSRYNSLRQTTNRIETNGTHRRKESGVPTYASKDEYDKGFATPTKR
nr:MAG TPA_asm: helix-turn-helix domain protein [Caudoviricetes sp.]